MDYNPCTPFSEGTKCDDDLVCAHDADRKNFYSAGRSFDTQVAKGGSVLFKYIGTKEGGITRETAITLVCDRNADTPIIQKVVKNASENKYSFELTSRCACPGVCPVTPPGTGKNMSVGSILLTIFFVMFGAYFIFGHLFLKYHRNLDGESSIPNYEFWKELPTNVKEGFAFTKRSLFGREEGYENI